MAVQHSFRAWIWPITQHINEEPITKFQRVDDGATAVLRAGPHILVGRMATTEALHPLCPMGETDETPHPSNKSGKKHVNVMETNGSVWCLYSTDDIGLSAPRRCGLSRRICPTQGRRRRRFGPQSSTRYSRNMRSTASAVRRTRAGGRFVKFGAPDSW